MTPSERRRVPVLFTVIVTIIALPALLLPTFIALAEDEMAESKKIFMWLFPFYLIVGAYLAWQCYGRRTVMSWILLALMFMTDCAMILLISM